MSDDIQNKIRKLLNLANNSGATEHESDRAMELATAMMLKYGISQDQLVDKPKIGKSATMEADNAWEEQAGKAAAYLYGCDLVRYRGTDQFYFVGREDNRSATIDTFEFLKEQIEAQYKMHLPRGLSKAVRAEFRRTFKFACANRVYARAYKIVKDLSENEAAAQKATGATALVVVAHRKELEVEVKEFLSSQGVKFTPPKKYKGGNGTVAGYNAGNNVRLNRGVQ